MQGTASTEKEHQVMIFSHKIQLDPNNKQRTHFCKAAGVARFVYNWSLAEWSRMYEAWKEDNTKEKPSYYVLDKKLNAIKKDQFPWMSEVSANIQQTAGINLQSAFLNFFKGIGQHPVFKKKGKCKDSFKLSNAKVTIKGSNIRIEKLGWVRMSKPLRFKGKIMSATLSRTADKWFVSIAVELDDFSHLTEPENQGTVGVDLGVKDLAVLSNGEVFTGSKPHKKLLKTLQRRSRSLSRKVKGSKNRKKAAIKVAKLHYRIACVRNDALHKLTTDLTRRFDTIVIEDLNVSGMVKNHKIARAISDMGFYEFRRQLEYKAAMRDRSVIVVDQWFPSSKTCSVCGFKQETLPLSVRNWECPTCNTVHNRDQNAAQNLVQYAVGSTVSACGVDGSGNRIYPIVKPATMKQEANTNPVG